MNTPDKVNNYEKEHFLSLFARVITGAVPRILRESLTDRQTDSLFLFLLAKSTGKSKMSVSYSSVLFQL